MLRTGKFRPLSIEVIERFAFKYPEAERGLRNSYYSHRPFESKVWWMRYKAILNLWDSEEQESVLDLGGGHGFLLPSLAKESKDTYYLDSDVNLAQFAAELVRALGLKNVHILAGDAEHMPFRDETFHTVFAADALEHVPGLRAALGEVKRVLLEGGDVITCSPSENLLFILLRLIRRRSLKEETHLHTNKETQEIMQQLFHPVVMKRVPYLPRLFIVALHKKSKREC